MNLSSSEGAGGAGQIAAPTRFLTAEGSGLGRPATAERSRDSGGGAAGGGHVRGRGGVRPVNKARHCLAAWARLRGASLHAAERRRMRFLMRSDIASGIAWFGPLRQSSGCEHRAAGPGHALNQQPKILLFRCFSFIPVVKIGLRGEARMLAQGRFSSRHMPHRFFRPVFQPSAQRGLSVPHRMSSAGLHQQSFASV